MSCDVKDTRGTMSDRDVIAALQRQAAEAEVERRRLVGELDAEQAKRAELVAALNGVLWMAEKWADDGNMREEREACEDARNILGKATT